jgi:hypothetical protein
MHPVIQADAGGPNASRHPQQRADCQPQDSLHVFVSFLEDSAVSIPHRTDKPAIPHIRLGPVFPVC